VQHLPPEQHVDMYREVCRILIPGGIFFMVHWFGPEASVDKIFPAHPELKAHTGALTTVSQMLLENGFAVRYREVMSRSYHDCMDLASWAVIEAVKR
jgi:hypothetical protein